MERLIEIHSRLKERLGDLGDVCIAGGAVRDTLMDATPKDYDLFVLHDSGTKFETIKTEIRNRISDLSEIAPVVEWHKSEPFLVATVDYQGVEVQILANPAPSMHALIETFDWNVCLFGFDGAFVTLEDVANIGPGKELRLNKVTYPLSTLRRGFRFSERFLMKLGRGDIKLLCEQIVCEDKEARAS